MMLPYIRIPFNGIQKLILLNYYYFNGKIYDKITITCC